MRGDWLKRRLAGLALALALAVWLAAGGPALAGDLADVKAAGVLRHLGMTYANFVSGQGDGLDVELIQQFAKHLGVRYEFVPTDWDALFADLTGSRYVVQGGEFKPLGQAPVQGDLVAIGLTVLPGRKKVVEFSAPTFPTQVWLIVRADSPVTPITPSGDVKRDIEATRAKLGRLTLLCKAGTCLDPAFFGLERVGAKPKLFPGSLNDLAPAMMLGEADATLLDVPDALVALQKYPGKIKIVGPMTEEQDMAVAFAKESPRLRQEFNRFLSELKASGEYGRLVKKYYPLASMYFPDFFQRK